LKSALRRDLGGVLICFPLALIFSLTSWVSIWLWSLRVLRGFARRQPPQRLSPAAQNCPAGPPPKARQSRFKSPQQRSNEAEKPVISEQESCSPAILSAVRIPFAPPTSLLQTLRRLAEAQLSENPGVLGLPKSQFSRKGISRVVSRSKTGAFSFCGDFRRRLV
jgi:hypothetical protein